MRPNQIAYVFDHFFLYYNGDRSILKVDYGTSNNARLQIAKQVPDGFFNERHDLAANRVIMKKWRGRSIPFPFANGDSHEIISGNDVGVVVNYDIVAAIFYFLSGWSEFVNSPAGTMRTGFDGSIVQQLDTIGTPVVDYYLDILRDALERAYDVKLTTKRPFGDKPFAACLSHDIDKVNSAWKEDSLSALKKGNIFAMPRLVLKRMFGEDDWFNFDRIAGIEQAYGAKSTFFFLPRKNKENADYDVRSRSLGRAITLLAEGGNDIGVHGSLGTHNSSDKLREDIMRIDHSDITGNRFHFLAYDNHATPNVLALAGMHFDCTLGFAEHIGFRRGSCRPFFIYDCANNSSTSVLEIPLHVMDTTLQHRKYMNVPPGEALSLINPIFDEIEKFNGVVGLLWHNNFFSKHKYAGWQQVYEKCLIALKSRNALLTSAREINELICQ